MVRLAVSDKLHIESFTGSRINVADNFGKNTINGEYADGRKYVTQRPSINIKTDVSALGGIASRGRGIFYWDKEGANYTVNDNVVYKNDYGTTCTLGTGAAFSQGTEKVYFAELNDYLIIVDSENNKGYTIDRGVSSTVYNQIPNTAVGETDNFPTALAEGVVVLDGFAFVMDTDGNIFNSDLNNPTLWRALSFIEASREADGGIYIDKHHDHIVAFGDRSIEFFFNAGNPTDSPLEKRRDISYNYGLVSGKSAFREADNIYGIGVYPSGGLYPYVLDNFQIKSIANPTFESYITQAHVVEASNILGSGFSTGGMTFYAVTFYRIQTDIVPDITTTFDGKGWNPWEIKVGSNIDFPLVAWSIRTGKDAVSGEGILANGDIITVNDDFIPQDSLLAIGYYETGVVADGYVTDVLGTTLNIEMVCRTGPYDGGTNSYKFMYDLELIGDTTQSEQTATIKWADGNSVVFTPGRSIRTTGEKMTRLGRFKRRNIEFDYSGDEQIRLEGFDCEITAGED